LNETQHNRKKDLKNIVSGIEPLVAYWQLASETLVFLSARWHLVVSYFSQRQMKHPQPTICSLTKLAHSGSAFRRAGGQPLVVVVQYFLQSKPAETRDR